MVNDSKPRRFCCKKGLMTNKSAQSKMIAIFLTTCFVSLSSSELIVETSSGPVQSVAALSDDVEAFLGIPYAEPPVGNLRFAKPLPKKPWKETYKASSLPPPCTQYSVEGDHNYFMPDTTNMSEDCLYLNIWTPKADYGHRLRPVIFYIYPGGFAVGSSDIKVHDGSRLASRGDVVVVTINYRLGALGYLLAYTEEADGSMGMYDQLLALKWVKGNAKAFGGDPENIVLMGASAGAVSVTLHIASPLTKGLFKGAIVHSGTVVHPFFQDDNARLFRNSETLAAALGCSNKSTNLSSDPRSVVKCLKEKPAKDLADVELGYFQTRPFMFIPRFDDEFLPKSSVELLQRGMVDKDIQVLIGISKNEGSVFLAFLLMGRNNNKVRAVNKNSAVMLGGTFAQLFGHPRAKELVKAYVENVKDRTSDGYSKVVGDIIGDVLVSCSTIFFADYVSLNSANNVYFYRFEYRSPSSPYPEWAGVTHLDEIQYVFGNPFQTNFTEEEINLSRQMMDRWSAFAKNGSPNIPNQLPWIPYSYRHPVYLDIGKEESIRLRPNRRCELWRKRMKAEIDGHLLATDVKQDDRTQI